MDTEEKNKGGRPTEFNTKYVKQAYKLTLLGYTNDQLAEFFEVATSTIHYWRHKFPKFSDAIQKGKEDADGNVALSLYQRAIGYTHKETDIKVIEGKIVQTELKKHYAPDPVSMFFWLKNRRPDLWRDNKDVKLTATGPLTFVYTEASGNDPIVDLEPEQKPISEIAEPEE